MDNSERSPFHPSSMEELSISNAMAEHRQEALDGGCDEYETKPVRLPSLLEKIEHFT
ncbi:MAG: hypothetical protein ACJZ3J_04110 [Candidatus Poseidoniales archaeon]